MRGTNLVAKYNYLNGAKSEYTYYTQNAHGDVVNLTDETGAVVKAYTYDAFGVEQNIDDSDANAFRYCGEYYDAETGTVYLRARYYDPSIGRFTSRDSFAGENEVPLSLNLYTYCHNNPIVYLDPSGHVAIVDDVVILTFLILATLYVASSAYVNNSDSYGDVYSSPYSFPGYREPVVSPYDDKLDSPITFAVPDAVSIPQADSATKTKEKDNKQQNATLYHYTNLSGLIGILKTQQINPSIKANNPKDARHGNGQYFTDLDPCMYSSSQIARRLIRRPNPNKYTFYIEIDVTGLPIENPDNNIYLHRSEMPLCVIGRINSLGPVSKQKKE